MTGFRAFCFAITGLLLSVIPALGFAWYPSPGIGSYYEPYSRYSSMISPWRGTSWMPYSYYRGPFAYNGPWGNMNGGINPDGSFWVNIRFGGSYQDLQALIAVMQMSGAMQMR